MAITPLPPYPSRNVPSTFAALADAWVLAINQFVAECNALSSTATTLSGGTMTGTLGFVSGLVGAPSGFGTGDSNTGFWFPAPDTFAVSVGGAEKIRVTVSGVQISNGVAGGFSPTASFHVRDGGFFTNIFAESLVTNGGATLTATAANSASISATAYGNIIGGTIAGLSKNNLCALSAFSSSALLIYTGGAQIIAFGTNNAEGMRLNASNELQIGSVTDQGAFLLQVNSQIWATNATISTSDATMKRELAPLSDETLRRISEIPTRMYIRKDRPEDGSRAGYWAQDWEAVFGLETGIVKMLNSKKLALDESAAHGLKIMALEKRLSVLEGSSTCR